MKRIIEVILVFALAVAGGVLFVEMATSAPLAGAATAAPPPPFACVSGHFYFQDVGQDYDGYINANRFVLEGNYTGFCSNSKVATNVEFYALGSNQNCLTYGGTKTGPGYFYLKTCSHYASQTFTWYGDALITDEYTGTSYCMNGTGYLNVIDVAKCNANNENQVWNLKTII